MSEELYVVYEFEDGEWVARRDIDLSFGDDIRPCGFGKTKEEALDDMLKKEGEWP